MCDLGETPLNKLTGVALRSRSLRRENGITAESIGAKGVCEGGAALAFQLFTNLITRVFVRQ